MATNSDVHPLQRLRSALGLSRRVLAREVGVSHVFIHQVETGSEMLGRRSALKILDCYRDQMAEARITLEDLLRGSKARAA